MGEQATSLPGPNPEQRRVAAGQHERANQVIATGDFNYGMPLLLRCCKLDPANLVYRKSLRRAQKKKHKNNLRGSFFAWLTNILPKAKIKKAKRDRDWLLVLDLGEQALVRNPWDVGIQRDMAEAADHLGLLDLAVWILEEARMSKPKSVTVNRQLAELYEQRGNFQEAMTLWQLIRKTDPNDPEALGKIKDLTAHETIARGHYEEAVGGLSPARATPPPRSSPAQSTKKPEPSSKPSEKTGGSAILRSGAGGEEGLLARLAQEPTDPHAYLQLAELYRRTGRLDEAKELLQTGLGPTGNDFELSIVLADLEIEPFRQNLILTERKLQESNDEELRRIRIRLLKEINSRELELYRQKADRYPEDMNHRYEVGVRLLRADQVDEAIRELQTARAETRLRWKCALYLGRCFLARKNWKLAKRNFEEALQNLPDHHLDVRKDILFQLASGCASTDDLNEALEWANELANLDFSYQNIGQLIDDWEARLS